MGNSRAERGCAGSIFGFARVRIPAEHFYRMGGISYSRTKNLAKRDSPPPAGCCKQHLLIRRSAIPAERFYRIGELSYSIKKGDTTEVSPLYKSCNLVCDCLFCILIKDMNLADINGNLDCITRSCCCTRVNTYCHLKLVNCKVQEYFCT